MNHIDTGGHYATLAGGDSNRVQAANSTIGGGIDNLIAFSSCGCKLPGSTIAGGRADSITGLDARWYNPLPRGYVNPVVGTIAGGLGNTVNGHYGSVGGGIQNHALGYASAIPGGQGLEALDNQTVIGSYNASVSPYSLLLQNVSDSGIIIGPYPPPDAPIFIIGNGSAGARHNAAEVTQQGTMIVTGVNLDTYVSGGSAINVPFAGGRNVDNSTLAWGDISAVGGVNHNVGVAGVTHPGLGIYIVHLAARALPESPAFWDTLSTGCITATLNDDNADTLSSSGSYGGSITVSHIGIPYPMSFIVSTYGNSSGCCQPFDRPFFFKLIARP